MYYEETFNLNTFYRRIVAFILIFVWVFSGWPQIYSFAEESASAPVQTAISTPWLNFADTLLINDVQAEIVMNNHGQRGFLLRAGILENVPVDKLSEGWVSWAFVPASIDVNNFSALRQYAFDHFFGFTNDPQNVLIDDGLFVLDEPVRVVVFSWKCVTESCDSIADLPAIQFISGEAVNYHTSSAGGKINLLNYQR